MTSGLARVDGRIARSERTRSAVARAFLELLEAGELRPTSAAVAERAGVSLRSVFQHFEDMESLYAAVAEAQMERLGGYISQEEGSGPLPPRVRSFVDRRSELLETITPVRRAALLQEPFSESLARRLKGAHAMAREELERTFSPELARIPTRTRAQIVWALDVATNFAAWDTARRMNGLTIEESKQVMERLISALLKEAAE
jgi:AcrR family transcriptional regulator